MKVLRITFSIIGLLILIAIAAACCLLYFVNPNKLKPIIAQEVKRQTGYNLVIDGNFSWSFYPLVGVKVEHMTLQEPNAAPFLDLHGVTMAAEFSQLLHGVEHMNGNLHIDDVRLASLHATNADIKLGWENNILALSPITASLYEGSLEGMIHGKDLTTLMQWGWDLQLNNVQIKPLLLDLNGDDSKIRISGTAQLKIIASTYGKTRDDVIKNMKGTTDFRLVNGALEGIDLNYMIQTADALINHNPVTPQVTTGETLFDSLTGSAVIKDGAFETDNLALVAPTFKANATGSINLLYQAINFQLSVLPPNEKWQVPVSITGSLKHPDIKLDTAELQKILTKEQISQAKSKIQEEIQKHVPGKAGDMLQKLIGH